MRSWEEHKEAVLARDYSFFTMVVGACLFGSLLWAVLAFAIAWRVTTPLSLEVIPPKPPVALLRHIAPDPNYPRVTTRHTLLFAALSETSAAIARDVNRCFYFVSGRPAFVTSTSGGQHRTGSAHYRLEAVDFRLRHLTQKQIIRVLNCTEVLLGEQYYIEVERAPLHLHAAMRTY